MSKVTEYRIVSGGPEAVEALVKEAISAGWEPTGGPFLHVNFDPRSQRHAPTFYQAMVQRAEAGTVAAQFGMDAADLAITDSRPWWRRLGL